MLARFERAILKLISGGKMIRTLRILLVGVIAVQLWGCGSGRLIPQDIETMMASEGGQMALKAIEGHGGIWRWRQRSFVTFDYVKLAVSHGMDTTVENRKRDTTIAPRLDTLINLRERITFDLAQGFASSQSASTIPLVQKGMNAETAWLVRDNVVSQDSNDIQRVTTHLLEARDAFGLPFSLLDTTLRLTVGSEAPAIDTTVAKGKDPGTFDTTITPYTMQQLRIEPAPAGTGLEWLVLYLDSRDGRVRKLLRPRSDSAASSAAWLTIWSDQQNTLGLKLGGRRATYPADGSGGIQGPLESDRRYYNVEFSRSLDSLAVTFTAPVVPIDTLPAAGDSTTAAGGA
jgi:hypothetical protein